MLSMIFGSLIGGILITRVQYTTFFLILTAISLIAAIYFFGVQNPDPIEIEPGEEVKE